MYQNMQLWLCKIPSLRKEIWVAQNKLKCHDEPAAWASGTEGQTPRTQFPPPPLDPLDATRKAQGWLESEGCAPALLLLAVTPVAVTSSGLPRRHSSKEPAGQYKRCKRRGFDAEFGRFSLRRRWQPTPVFLPGESHGQRSLAGYSPWDHKEWEMTEHAPSS